MPESFAALLARLRAERGLTPSELARAAGVTPQAIYHLESGRYQPLWSTVRALATALGVTTDELAPRD